MLTAPQLIHRRYRLVRELGSGAMGTVWAAHDQTLDRPVAVKLLAPELSDDPTDTKRFLREARAAARVRHRFIVEIYDFGVTEEGESFMVLECLDGRELADAMWIGPTLTARQAVSFLADALHGLQAVHDAGIVHRDLKPANIYMIEEEGRYVPKLLDFGISKWVSDKTPVSMAPGSSIRRRTELTGPGITLGTLMYMSPEQLMGDPLDGRSDLFAMGLILFEWLAGGLPYEAMTFAARIRALQRPSWKIIETRPDLGSELSEVLDRALRQAPEERFPSAKAMAEALRAVVPSIPADARTVMHEESLVRVPGPGAGVKPAQLTATEECPLDGSAGVLSGALRPTPSLRPSTHVVPAPAPTAPSPTASGAIDAERRAMPLGRVGASMLLLIALGMASVWWWKGDEAPQATLDSRADSADAAGAATTATADREAARSAAAAVHETSPVLSRPVIEQLEPAQEAPPSNAGQQPATRNTLPQRTPPRVARPAATPRPPRQAPREEATPAPEAQQPQGGATDAPEPTSSASEQRPKIVLDPGF